MMSTTRSPPSRARAPRQGAREPAAARSRLRIAVVGAGPKGFYCLERLAHALSTGALPPPVTIQLYEPHPVPGAGPNYDPRQPDYLRMNFANRKVDIWPRDEAADDERPSLVSWLRAHAPSWADPEGYAPRGLVGRYLHDGCRGVLETLRRHAEVHVTRARVERVMRGRDSWRVTAAGRAIAADEVVLTTGHDSRCPLESPPAHPRAVPAVFPVADHLGPDRVPPGAEVALRGFGLTAIDAILSLFEGRGGRFVAGPRPSVLDYRAGSDEARVVLPYCRSGRPMVPKPDGRRVPAVPESTGILAEGCAALRRVTADFASDPANRASVDAIRRVLCSTARALLRAASDIDGARLSGTALDEVSLRLEGLLSRPRGRFGGEGVVAAITRGLDVACGERPRDAEWALGDAWRGLYPALVERIGAGWVAGAAWRPFGRLTVEMERLAFGPPAENAARLLALVRCGRLDLSWIDAHDTDFAGRRPRLRRGSDSRAVDVWVNAVLAPPGIAPPCADLYRHLLEDGLVRLVSGTAGADIDAHAQAIGYAGQTSRGLAILGRATEGRVLGNDTLSRTLHPTVERWIAGLVARRQTFRAVRP